MPLARRSLLSPLLALVPALPLGAQTMPGGAVTAAQAGFGGALAIVGDQILVGEPNNQMRTGLVYVYGRGAGAAGTWTERAQLRAADGHSLDGFGASLAADGNVLVVGATLQGERRGAAYVFTRDGAAGAWRQVGRLAAAQGAEGSGFGAAVALGGDLIAVGAPAEAEQAGAVYLFRRGAGGAWAQEARLAMPQPEPRLLFGASVAVAGGELYVGAPGAYQAKGAVLVFRRDASGGQWTQAGRIAPGTLQPNDRFGALVRVSGGEAVIAAPYASAGTGAVHVYRRAGADAAWRETARLSAFDGARQELFGSAVAVDGDQLLVGAPRASGARGGVYHLARAAADSAWATARRLSGGAALEQGGTFGAAVALRGDLAAASIPGSDHGAGRVVVLARTAQGDWRATATLQSPDERIASVTGREVRCDAQGKASGFDCKDVELQSFLSVSDIGGGRGVRLNDVWGWTDPETNREYAIVGRIDGTSFVDVTDAANPRYLGQLPKTAASPASTWRDMKVYRNHAYIVADGAGNHGMQVFDLTQLRGLTGAPRTFRETARYDRIASAHNIVINEATGFAYAVGASSGGETCGGGLHMIDVREPASPKFAGCFADPQTGRANTGYTHDAQCVVYDGPDADYANREICLGSNETALSIADVTDKRAPKAIARSSYPNVGYSHQGWFTEDRRYFYMNDELDELNGAVPRTRTIIWDLQDLDDPQLVGEFLSPTSATDHNLYVKGNLMYQSHYQSGLRIVDISNPTQPVEVAFFDTVPYGTNTPGFGGSWSNYPYFRSGNIIVTSGSEGLFVLTKRDARTAM